MSSNAARDAVYGRRGGRWATAGAGRLLSELRQLRAYLQAEDDWPDPVDRTQLFHPDTIASSRAHDRDCGGRHRKNEPCPATAAPDDLAELWAGKARMARARHAAGQPLTVIDLEALRRAKRSQP